MHEDTIKLAHENFVTGHDGSNPFDILLTVFPVIPGTLSSILLTDDNFSLYNFGAQYMLCILPIVLSFTLLSKWAISINVCLIIIAGASWMHQRKTARKHIPPEIQVKSSRLPYLTSCRSTVIICTIIAILGVDFHCFPRRFAKTEMYGYSLMDIGASCFVFMNGLFDRFKKHRKGHLLSIAVLIVLGCLRLISVKVTNYQHHVTEYGVHANFFFTLAALKILCSLWVPTITIYRGFISSLVILLTHHFILTSGIADWTLSVAPRNNLVSGNREFLVSLPGYAVIYILGSVTAAFVLSILKESNFKQNLYLAGSTAVAISGLALLEIGGMRPSRRLANPSFVVWTVVFLLFFIAMFKSIDVVIEGISSKRSPILFELVNSNAMFFFLAANLLTGLINFAVDTMKMSFPMDFIIINIYVLSLLVTVYWIRLSGRKFFLR